MAKLGRLHSGGFIATYRCTAACGHCIQASSPTREAHYVTQGEARRTLGLVRALGCSSLHIGGGEPFIDVDGLETLIQEMDRARIGLDYIETNAFWARGGKEDRRLIGRLRDSGMTTLMLSLCPYHAAYVPLANVQYALEACEAEGVPTFVWQDQFAREVRALGDEEMTHSLEEYEAAFPGALDRLPGRFGARLLGRAAVTHMNLSATSTREILSGSRPCGGPLRAGHFHVDCFGSFIPPGCPGIGIDLEDAGDIGQERYPAVTTLLEGGVGALVHAAAQRGFVPRENYQDTCALCQHARSYLTVNDQERWPDLHPSGFYRELQTT